MPPKRRKKRPRAFFGVRRQDLPDRSSSEAEEAEEEVPVPVSCASGKKLALSPCLSSAAPPGPSQDPCFSEYQYVGKMEGYRLVSCASQGLCVL